MTSTPFIKQPEINFGSKNSSFNKTIAQGPPGIMGSVIKNPQNFSKLNTDMPPPQNVQKLSKEVRCFSLIYILISYIRAKSWKNAALMKLKNDN